MTTWRFRKIHNRMYWYRRPLHLADVLTDNQAMRAYLAFTWIGIVLGIVGGILYANR